MSKQGYKEERDWAMRGTIDNIIAGRAQHSDLTAVRNYLDAIACALYALATQYEIDGEKADDSAV